MRQIIGLGMFVVGMAIIIMCLFVPQQEILGAIVGGFCAASGALLFLDAQENL